MRYRKKPVEIEAMQWAGGRPEQVAQQIVAWVEEYETHPQCGIEYGPTLVGAPGPNGEDWGLLEIDTLEGTMDVAPYDYVICGVQGEFYPCKPDIFEATYEAVE